MWCLRWELVDDWTLCREIKDASYARGPLGGGGTPAEIQTVAIEAL